MKRGDKIYLDNNQEKESDVNRFLECRDGVVEVYEYYDSYGYSQTRLFSCEDTKHEIAAIIRQVYNNSTKEWFEETMFFDSDAFEILKAIINGKKDCIYGKYSLVRDYSI